MSYRLHPPGVGRPALVRAALVVCLLTLTLAALPSEAATHPPTSPRAARLPAAPLLLAPMGAIFPSVNCGGEGGSDWLYICARGEYQAWFAFDVSGVPPGTQINSLTFTAYLYEDDDETVPAQRTLWYDSDDSWVGIGCPGNAPADDLVGTVITQPDSEGWKTFTIDLSGHDWQNDLADGYITLMLTGPLNGDHICGEVDLLNSSHPPYLLINGATVVPALGLAGLLTFVGLLICLAVWILRRT